MGSSDLQELARADDLAQVLQSLQRSIDRHGDQFARLSEGLATVLARLDLLGAGPAGTAAAPAPAVAAKQLSINWVIGPPDNLGWAYGNNARRLSGLLPKYRHMISGSEPADIAIYFDALVAERFPVKARKSILRIGGPRPLDRLFGNDVEAMRKALRKFDAIVALNGELYLRVQRAHSNVHLIPNALDLKEWHPSKVAHPEDRPFTIGFAASLKSSAEAETKGYGIAKGAAARLGARLFMTSKGKEQIAHERMVQDFYAHIDVLVSPVGPGREGTSNVIMEALSLGIPVITTEHAGYHGEFLIDGKAALIRPRDELAFAEAIALLHRDQRLRRRIGAAGRAFAERHHDLTGAASAYKALAAQVLAPKSAAKPRRLKVSFVPFWEPVESFGSSRLRAKYPAEFLQAGAGRLEVGIGYSEQADVVVVVQMCSDQLLAQLRGRPNQYVVYDVCDRYFENPRLFRHLDPPVDSQRRFEELVERADLVITPTRDLKADIAARHPSKAVRHVPEPADYGARAVPSATGELRKVALWFGNPDRGNFESARWMLDHLRDVHGFELLIVSRPGFFKKMPEYAPHVVEWSLDAMAQAFARAGVCVVAHDSAEQAKSPNRFIAALMHGVPALVHNSPSCAELLLETGHEFAVVADGKALSKSIVRLQGAEFRSLYVRRMQRHLGARFGEEATAATYDSLIARFTHDKALFAEGARRVAFVSHNMALGEGAPWSLMELVQGLAGQGIAAHVFSPAAGPLLAQYQQAGIPVKVFDPAAAHTVKVLNARYVQAREAFRAFLKDNRIEAVVCNTVKTAPYAHFARELGIPSTIIVRESYTAEERFSYYFGEAKLAAIQGLTQAAGIVFVAEASRQTWADQPFEGQVEVIPNGISPGRFVAQASVDKAVARAALGLPAEGVIALCVGTVSLRKGQAELLEAFAALPEDVRGKARLLFLGATENGYLAQFRALVDALPEGLRERVLVVPTTEDVGPWYRSADVFLMNSSSEAYPRSVVEALYFGLPILSTRVFGVQEQVRQGENGWMYEFNDMAAWSTHFSALVRDQALRSRMSAAAGRSFWMLTGYNEMLLAYRTVLAGLLARSAARGEA